MFISGLTFRVMRRKAKLTTTEFARRAGCAQSHVSMVEHGQRGLSEVMLRRWLYVYGMDRMDVDFKHLQIRVV